MRKNYKSLLFSSLLLVLSSIFDQRITNAFSVVGRSRNTLNSHCCTNRQQALFLGGSKETTTVLNDNDVPNHPEIFNSNALPNINSLDWVNYGLSWVYLAHFASIYVQLPGLFGATTGLAPIADRLTMTQEQGFWALHVLPTTSPELSMELFAALGILVSMLQIAIPKSRHGWAGIVTFGLLWLCWHDLVQAGGRFTAYQMDVILLDAAPLSLLAAAASLSGSMAALSTLLPAAAAAAATFGYRWLLARLYLGAGAVKLLSCDESWRNLSAVHWHLQSQPLPNMVGATAYHVLPTAVTESWTWLVLVVEMAAPFLFLAPSVHVRRLAFVLNACLMAGISVFGDFGCLQLLLAIVGLSLLDDLPPAPGQQEITATTATLESSDSLREQVHQRHSLPQEAITAVSAVALVLAVAGGCWAAIDVTLDCQNSLAIAPLALGMITLGGVVAILPFLFAPTRLSAGLACILSLALFGGSIVPLFQSVRMQLPYEWTMALQSLNIGAIPYGLFAVITGVGGRPVASIEASYSMDGPWTYVPLLYQINDPSKELPFAFPHFPRLDWTLWFVPLGETGAWIENLLRGIVSGDQAIVDNLLDGPAFHAAFPNGPPEFVRVMPKLYELNPDGGVWSVSLDPSPSMMQGVYSREMLLPHPNSDAISSWPSLPLVRSLANAERPEYFVWKCLATAETLRRVVAAAHPVSLDEEPEQ